MAIYRFIFLSIIAGNLTPAAITSNLQLPPPAPPTTSSNAQDVSTTAWKPSSSMPQTTLSAAAMPLPMQDYTNNFCISVSTNPILDNTIPELHLKIPRTRLMQCWKYCKHTEECTSFAVTLLLGDCKMYTAYIMQIVVLNLYEAGGLSRGNEYHAMATKYCMQVNENCHKIEDLVGESRRTGLLIRHQISRNCLSFEGHFGKDRKYMDWKPCSSSDAILWKISSYDQLSGTAKFSVKDSKKCLEWSLVEEDLVLSVTYGFTFLATCSGVKTQSVKVSYTSKWEPCTTSMSLKPLSLGIFLVPQRAQNQAKEDAKHSDTLLDIDLIVPSQQPCLKFNITNGVVLENRDSAPFFLPGEIVTMRCNDGFGIEHLNFSVETTLTCSYKTHILPTCKRISSKKSSCLELRDVLMINVCVISFVVFLVVCFIMFIVRHYRQKTVNIGPPM